MIAKGSGRVAQTSGCAGAGAQQSLNMLRFSNFCRTIGSIRGLPVLFSIWQHAFQVWFAPRK